MHAGAGEKSKNQDITVAQEKLPTGASCTKLKGIARQAKNRTLLANGRFARPACGVRRGLRFLSLV
jgi:hypothetical protein